MTEAQSLTLSLSSVEHGSSDNVILEQEPWDPYIGMLTRGGVVAYLRGLLFEGDGLEENCAGGDAGISSTVYAYPSPPNLNYSIGISHGELGERVVDVLEYAEVVQVQNETNPPLRYPTDEIFSAVWLTDAFEQGGQPLPRPAIDIAGASISLNEPVYGTIFVIYKVTRHTYRVTINRRPESVMNAYQSYVFAVWDGGNNFIEYQLPEEIEDGGRCNTDHRGDGDITSPDRCEPMVYPEDIYRQWDYCQNCVLVYDGFEVIDGVGIHKWRCE